MHDPPGMYNLLFGTAWNTLEQFSWTNLHAETGAIAVLHTWGQNLSLHPHLHCIVPGGGLNIKGNWKPVKISKMGKAYLFPVENLSGVFRAKFITALNKRYPQESSFNKELKKTDWVVYAKEPFGGPQQVVEYLGRYTHKTAISNHRLLLIDENGIDELIKKGFNNAIQQTAQKELSIAGNFFEIRTEINSFQWSKDMKKDIEEYKAIYHQAKPIAQKLKDLKDQQRNQNQEEIEKKALEKWRSV